MDPLRILEGDDDKADDTEKDQKNSDADDTVATLFDHKARQDGCIGELSPSRLLASPGEVNTSRECQELSQEEARKRAKKPTEGLILTAAQRLERVTNSRLG